MLAVVVILAILLAIAVLRIINVIESARISAFTKNEEIIVNVVRNYLIINEVALPIE